MLKAILLLSLIFSSPAFSYHFCKGNLSDVWVSSGGSVFVNGSWAPTHTKVCEINADWKGVIADTCKAWLSLSTAAQVSNGNVILRYSDEDMDDCNTIPTYGESPAPHYVMLDK